MERSDLDEAYRKGFREGYEKAAGVPLRKGAEKEMGLVAEAAHQLLGYAARGGDALEAFRQNGMASGHFLGTLAKRGLLSRDRAKQLGWSGPQVVNAQIKFLREAFWRDGAEGETVHAVCDALEEARAEIARLKGEEPKERIARWLEQESKEESPSYRRAEDDIAAWLGAQDPVSVCRHLAEGIRIGEHRGRAQERRQWEIPVTFKDPNAAVALYPARVIARALRAQVCGDAEGDYVVVPFQPLLPWEAEELRKRLASCTIFAEVGTPIEFPVPVPGPSGVIDLVSEMDSEPRWEFPVDLTADDPRSVEVTRETLALISFELRKEEEGHVVVVPKSVCGDGAELAKMTSLLGSAPNIARVGKPREFPVPAAGPGVIDKLEAELERMARGARVEFPIELIHTDEASVIATREELEKMRFELHKGKDGYVATALPCERHRYHASEMVLLLRRVRNIVKVGMVKEFDEEGKEV